MALDPAAARYYYLREGILEKIFALCKEREVVPLYGEKFGSRPSAVQFKGDLELLVKQGATSFHASVEHWSNTLALKSGMRRGEFDRLRTAWDLIIDIDSDRSLDYAKRAAMLLVQALKMHGVKVVSIKFSGRRGWHIGVHHKCLPAEINNKPIAAQYPEMLQIITAYLKNFIKDRLRDQLIKLDPELKEKEREKIDPYEFVHVEENWGPRHLFRMPYCFNEKSELISLPIELKDIAAFDPQTAKPEKVQPKLSFLDRWEENSARDLIIQALDWYTTQEEQKVAAAVKRDLTRRPLARAIPEAFFPPCYRNIMAGLKDGRKRAVFILINLLRTCGWSWEAIENKLKAWNAKNPDPLREVYITTQLNYAKGKTKAEIVPPPNCVHKGYYLDIGVCTPDKFCAKRKNPSSYALRKVRAAEAAAKYQRVSRDVSKEAKENKRKV